MLNIMWTKISFLLLVGGALSQSESWVVDVEQGPVRGYKDASGLLYKFLNIPYASAPTGINKFKAPLPPPQWTDPYEFTEKFIVCPQEMLGGDFIAALSLVQEDCLVANIYVPAVTNNTNLPVMVVVHGGAYSMGFGALNEYNSLVKTQEVIVITFNYRLGAHGFLCLGTEDIPGNAGMKDQVALLRWVQRNIAKFGGNPDDVTISGCSAGGGSVDFLTITPMNNGLFKKVITESGAIFGITAPQDDPVANARLYAKQLNFDDGGDIFALQEFYKNASLDLLLSKQSSYANHVSEKRDNLMILFTPCIEREIAGEERFLDDTPINIIKNGKYHNLPLLYGFAQQEGLLVLNEFNLLKDRMNEKFSNLLPFELEFESEAQKEEVAKRVKEFYFGDEDVSEQTIMAYVDYFSDVMFNYPMLKAANLRRGSLADTIYLYEYSFEDELSEPPTNTRANHCAQQYAVMDNFWDVFVHTEKYAAMKEQMRELWLNFVKTGNPTPAGTSNFPTWSTVNGINSPYMNLNSSMALENTPLLDARFKLWDSIYEAHYRAPIPPADPNSAVQSAISLAIVVFVTILYILS